MRAVLMRCIATTVAFAALAACSAAGSVRLVPVPPGTAIPRTATGVVRTLMLVFPRTLRLVTTYTVATDPDHLLGTASGCLSRAAFAESRARHHSSVRGARDNGGYVEVFGSTDLANARAVAIQQLKGKADEEYDFVAGPVLLRLTGDIDPSVAQDYFFELHVVMRGFVHWVIG